jgi:hypothetical protein
MQMNRVVRMAPQGTFETTPSQAGLPVWADTSRYPPPTMSESTSHEGGGSDAPLARAKAGAPSASMKAASETPVKIGGQGDDDMVATELCGFA